MGSLVNLLQGGLPAANAQIGPTLAGPQGQIFNMVNPPSLNQFYANPYKYYSLFASPPNPWYELRYLNTPDPNLTNYYQKQVQAPKFPTPRIQPIQPNPNTALTNRPSPMPVQLGTPQMPTRTNLMGSPLLQPRATAQAGTQMTPALR